MTTTCSCVCSLTRALVCSMALAAAPLAAAPAADRLDHAEIAAGTVLAAAGDQIAAVTPDGAALQLWDVSGRFLRTCRLDTPAAGARPAGVALKEGFALVSYAVQDEKRMLAVLVDLRTGAAIRRFAVDRFPAGLAATPDRWLFERLLAGEPPTLTLVGDDGTVAAEIEPPGEVLERAVQHAGDASYAFMRVASAGGRVWAVPSFSYELWSFTRSQGWRRVPMPACLEVFGRNLEGEDARRQMLARAETARDEERQRLVDRVEWTRKLGLRVTSWATAAPVVAGRGDLLAVVTNLHPERETDGCRLDVWRTSDERLTASLRLPGLCPSFVALAPGGAWLLRRGRFDRIPIAQRVGADPCGS